MFDLLVTQALVVTLQVRGALVVEEPGLNVDVAVQVGPEDGLGLVGQEDVVDGRRR